MVDVYCPKCRSEYPSTWKACPTDTTTLLKSAQIGKYSIEGVLGVGGMGAVYRAINPDTKGRVAVKVMNPEVATAEQMRLRFQREAASVAALRTSHVVTVYDFGSEDDGTLYLVMELLDGHALREEIRPGPEGMDLARIQMVMDGALRGLAAAHKAGIVHRDLKPENIFVADTDDGEVPKLLDFGIARVRTKDQDLTRTGSLMGTAPYMATEQVGAGGEVGPWTDVYAMGAILYEMLAGVPAFGGDTITDVLQRVLKSEVVALKTVRDDLPEAVYALIERCLDPVPERRPQDAEAMRIALNAAKLVPAGTVVPPPHKTRPERSELGMAETEGRETPIPEPIRKLASQPPRRDSTPAPGRPVASTVDPAPPKRARWPVALGALVVVGGGVVAVKMMNPGGAAPPPDAAVVAEVPPPPIAIDAAIGPPPVEIDAGVDPHAGMIEIPSGAYAIGAPKNTVADALPETTVQVAAFWIDKHEMTIGELRAALPTLPAKLAAETTDDAPSTPARFADWVTATAACEAVGKRLPTEIEWETAARTTPMKSARAHLKRTDSIADLIAPNDCASPKGICDCSVSGLCDMLGGVREWTSDDWPKKARQKVVRGASYRVLPGGKLDSIHLRVAIGEQESDNEIGFRCARNP